MASSKKGFPDTPMMKALKTVKRLETESVSYSEFKAEILPIIKLLIAHVGEEATASGFHNSWKDNYTAALHRETPSSVTIRRDYNSDVEAMKERLEKIYNEEDDDGDELAPRMNIARGKSSTQINSRRQ